MRLYFHLFLLKILDPYDTNIEVLKLGYITHTLVQSVGDRAWRPCAQVPQVIQMLTKCESQ